MGKIEATKSHWIARLLSLRRNEDAYALTLTLIALPFILGMAVLVIDASRVTNLHTDAQNAVDAMALAGARELDGRNDAIPRAKAAIAALSQNQVWFGGGGAGLDFGGRANVTYVSGNDAGSTVEVRFLTKGTGTSTDLPASDNTAITGYIANDGTTAASNIAAYVWVVAKPQSLTTMFPIPGMGRDTVSVSNVEAVATYTASACDITPIFICNPFEAAGKSINDAFSDGSLYGREIQLNLNGGSTIGPGNFGFLRTYGNGANVLGEALGKGASGVCFKKTTLETEPGKNVGQAINGINTRMGLYGGSFKNEDGNPDYAPDVNVRKGQASKKTGSGVNTKYTFDCTGADTAPNTSTIDAMGFPAGSSPVTLPGGVMTSNGWDVNKYWDISHGNLATAPSVATYTAPTAPAAVTNNKPSLPTTAVSGTYKPSRYDVYQYEITNNRVTDAAPNKETGKANKVVGSGASVCYKSPSVPKAGRRELFAAVVNCNANSGTIRGGNADFPAEAYARMFMTRPATDGANKSLFLEVIDVTGKGGLGTVEDYLREEAELVR